MGKYSNVNASGMISAIDTALSELESHKLSGIVGHLPKNTSTSIKVTQAYFEIVSYKNYNGTIANLKEKLNKLKEAASEILNYQQYEKDMNNYSNQMDLYYKKRVDYWNNHVTYAGYRDYWYNVDWEKNSNAKNNYYYYKRLASNAYSNYSTAWNNYSTAEQNYNTSKTNMETSETTIDGLIG